MGAYRSRLLTLIWSSYACKRGEMAIVRPKSIHSRTPSYVYSYLHQMNVRYILISNLISSHGVPLCLSPNPLRQLGTQIKHTVPFTSPVNAALLQAAAAARVEPTEIIQRATINKLIEDGFIEKTDADRIKLFWALVDRVTTAAQNICLDDRFSSSVTLDAIHDCMEGPG